ncbi:MAG TPA: DUF2779 domain-containing protein [Spirochaetota bacterium]|nr:DUF2779 domain-containing protein [Spirochaetota bacterium]
MPKLLTKSKFLNALQCPRWVWYAVNRPAAIPDYNKKSQYLFSQGNLVGEYAKQLFPDGITIPCSDFKESLQLSKQQLQQQKPLFEAGFIADGCYSRVDVLIPVGDKGWDIAEVKSGASVKDIHVMDVAFQRYCLSKAGLKINRCWLIHVNNKYVRAERLDIYSLFCRKDITGKVLNCSREISGRISNIKNTIKNEQAPVVNPGSFCTRPYDCPLISLCWKDMPEENVFQLFADNRKGDELSGNGILKQENIPDDFHLTRLQQIQKKASVEKKPQLRKKALSDFITLLQFPVYFLDFESYSSPVPFFKGMKPYDQYPFMYSLKKINNWEAEEENFIFLSAPGRDQRDLFIKRLVNDIDKQGSIIVYGKDFELKKLDELAGLFPAYRISLEKIKARFIDLQEPFRRFDYYHPDQAGNVSMKKIVPALTGHDYRKGIANGYEASLGFFHIAHVSKKKDEIATIINRIKTYCCSDTAGMKKLLFLLKDSITF